MANEAQRLWEILTNRLTATRASNLDNLDAAISSRSGHSAADIWGVATRALTDKTGFSISGTKTVLDDLNDLAQAAILSDATPFAGADIASILAGTALLEHATYGLSALETELETIRQKATGPAWNQDTDSLEAIREAIDGISTKGLAYGSPISGSVTPTDGAENTVVETDGTGDYAQDFEMFLSINLGEMLAGDTVVIKLYKKVDGTTYSLADTQEFSDVQTIEAWEMDALWGDEVMDVKITLAQTAGTYRTFNYRGAVRKST